MLVVLIEPFAVIGGIFAFAVMTIGFLIYIVMAGTTNYANVGIGMGISILGLMCMLISIGCALFQIFCGDTKKKKLLGVFEILVVLGLGIIGYCFPAYNQAITVQYSKIASIFVTPLYAYILIVAINVIAEFKGAGLTAGVITIIASLIAFVLLGSLIMGINYFFHNEKFLNWADTHYHYYDKRNIQHRISKYGEDDFETVVSKSLEEKRNEATKENKDAKSMKENFLAKARNSKGTFFEYQLKEYVEDKTNPYIVICEFIDNYQNGEDHKESTYYCKIDLSTYTYLGKMKYLYDIPDYLIDCMKSGKWRHGTALNYGIARCKSEGLPITKDNLKSFIKETKSKYICSEVETSPKGNLKVTMTRDTTGEFNPSNPPEIFYINPSTYEVNSIEL